MAERCPTCHAPVSRVGNDAFPFCSSRCRLIDLGKWLDEEYRIPIGESEPGGAPTSAVQERPGEGKGAGGGAGPGRS